MNGGDCGSSDAMVSLSSFGEGLCTTRFQALLGSIWLILNFLDLMAKHTNISALGQFVGGTQDMVSVRYCFSRTTSKLLRNLCKCLKRFHPTSSCVVVLSQCYVLQTEICCGRIGDRHLSPRHFSYSVHAKTSLSTSKEKPLSRSVITCVS